MPASLPIDEVLPELIAALRGGRSAVLIAPTGAGKTTRVPPALLAAGIGGGRPIVMLEPRRIAARAAARRMAEENGWTVGGEVGYQVRFEHRAGPETKILVVTEGILVQMLQADPFLEEAGAVIFDELHERSLQVDLSLAMARRVQREVRPDLALLAMSATLDPGPVAAFLGNAPTIESRGRLYPVDVVYLDRPDERPLPGQIASAVRRALGETPGDVLVFLPGVGEIQRSAEALAGLAAEQGLAVLPLYGDLPAESQDAVLRPGARRKVVLATNVAETSITIDGVTAVVDSGLVRRLRFDPSTGLDRLELGRISRASADQRAGRAGRQAPGFCLRLWPAYENATLAEREAPEIARVDLAGPALQLLAWGEPDLAAFDWFEAPSPSALEAAMLLLRQLGAVDGYGVTSLGNAMARLPAHPRLGRLLAEGHRLGRTREAALLAALLAERDPFPRDAVRGAGPRRASRSDLLDRLDALEAFERRGGGERLNAGAARFVFVLRARDQLADVTRRGLGKEGKAAPGDDALLRALLAAYPDRVARRREPRSPRGVMVGGRGVRLAEESAVLEAELFLCVDLDAGRSGALSEALVRKASAVEPEWLPADRLRTAVELEFDEQRERVAAWKRTRYEDLVIAEAEVPAPDAAGTERVLAEAAADRLGRALPLDDPEVASFLARVRCLADWRPELGLPRFGEEEIRELLPALAAGRKSFAELRRAPLLDVLVGALSYEQLEAVRREAPERLEVPSGSQVKLLYEPGKPPVLAARIQELFGLMETPRVAGGRVAVLLHLLAPNGRPQQVTHDLRSFWENTYPQVRKELQGRYPRHSWPLDPWNATPERRPRRPRG
ncbi:MAG TPA: ATP-dependent helicase HrpB [Thermoanaerobaculia bacterium]|nr:ATP-dependent helicase HrpB [Thermoanaerobaculia bacterium]